MITPAYGLTATERVLPRMALDFTTASLDPRVTFTRTGDTATVINSSGVIATALANVPRFDYDPSTLICKGLLIEEARTNLLIRSIPDLAVPTGYTVVVGSGTYTHTLESGFGVLTGFQQVVKNEQTVSGRSALNIVLTLTASTTYTLSIYVDKTNSSITSGNATILQATGYSDATGVLVATLANADANGRIAITFTTGADTSGNIRFGVGAAGDAVGVIYMAGWQLEAGAFPTSYIPTTTTSLTRNADIATMTGTNFSDWYNASAGTFVSSYSNVAANSYVFSAQNAAGTNRFFIRYTSSQSQFFPVAAGVSGTSAFSGSGLNQATAITSTAYNSSNIEVATLGAQTGTAFKRALAAVPTGIDRLFLGSLSGTNFFMNSHLKEVQYFPQYLTPSELSAFSK